MKLETALTAIEECNDLEQVREKIKEFRETLRLQRIRAGKSRMVIVRADPEPIEIKATPFGNCVCVHKNLNGRRYSVTHIPTGWGLSMGIKKTSAIKLARILYEQFGDALLSKDKDEILVILGHEGRQLCYESRNW